MSCNHKTNANGNCFDANCYNSNAKRHEDGRGGEVKPIAPMPDPDPPKPPPPRDN
jgi:hypothetical protein